MANENRNYTITIKSENLFSNDSAIAGDNKKSEKEQTKGLVSKEDAKMFAAAMVSYNTVKSFATQIINHEVSMVQLRTGSNELQERASFINDMVQQGVGVLEGAVTGAMVGGLPGFIAGLGISLISKTISYSQKVDEINTKRTVENVGREMTYIRAGSGGSRK